jgi:hypothetical protein
VEKASVALPALTITSEQYIQASEILSVSSKDAANNLLKEATY